MSVILIFGTFLAAQWWRPHASTAGVLGLIPGQGEQRGREGPTCQVVWQKKKKKNYADFFFSFIFILAIKFKFMIQDSKGTKGYPFFLPPLSPGA